MTNVDTSPFFEIILKAHDKACYDLCNQWIHIGMDSTCNNLNDLDYENIKLKNNSW